MWSPLSDRVFRASSPIGASWVPPLLSDCPQVCAAVGTRCRLVGDRLLSQRSNCQVDLSLRGSPGTASYPKSHSTSDILTFDVCFVDDSPNEIISVTNLRGFEEAKTTRSIAKLDTPRKIPFRPSSVRSSENQTWEALDIGSVSFLSSLSTLFRATKCHVSKFCRTFIADLIQIIWGNINLPEDEVARIHAMEGHGVHRKNRRLIFRVCAILTVNTFCSSSISQFSEIISEGPWYPTILFPGLFGPVRGF